MGYLGSFRSSLLLIAMCSYPSWVSNLAIDYEWESTICILDSIP